MINISISGARVLFCFRLRVNITPFSNDSRKCESSLWFFIKKEKLGIFIRSLELEFLIVIQRPDIRHFKVYPSQTLPALFEKDMLSTIRIESQ